MFKINILVGKKEGKNANADVTRFLNIFSSPLLSVRNIVPRVEVKEVTDVRGNLGRWLHSRTGSPRFRRPGEVGARSEPCCH